MGLLHKGLALILIQLSFWAMAQNGTLTGRITDNLTKEALIGVNITLEDKSGTTTDVDGNYNLPVSPGKHTVTLSYVGYKDVLQELEVKAGEEFQIDFFMDQDAKNILGDELVVTGSLFQRKASEEVISIEVIKPKLIANTQGTRIDETLRRVSGLNVADGQANIRSGSGWAYGVGSRVMVVLDGMSVLSPDRGDVKWSMLPIETVGQIEVLKGASSVLYGSSAMNGTINLQTMVPLKKPVTRFTAFQSFITPPKRKTTQWWDFPLMSYGTTFARAHKVTDHFEYVVGGNFFLQNQHYDDGYEFSSRINFRTKWTAKNNPNMKWGLAGIWMYNRETEFFYWQNDTTGALKAGELNDFNNLRISIDPYFVTYDKKGNKHDLKTRIWYNRPDFDTKTLLQTVDYQFTHTWEKIGLSWIVGTNNQLLWINVPDFVGTANKIGNLWAVFTQMDKTFKDKVTMSAGIRWEVYKYDINSGVTLPSSRFGINWHAGKNSYLRFNIGQAFRFPSFAERFVSTDLGTTETQVPSDTCACACNCYEIRKSSTLGIVANLNLKPEYGWTSEIGFQQKLGNKPNSKYRGLLDFALFWQEYRDLAEFTITGDDTTIDAFIKLQAQNISNARIAGMDFSIKNDITWKKHYINVSAGYTYSLPIEVDENFGFGLDKIGPYLKTLFRYMVRPIGGDTASYVLKYRNRHLITLDFEYTFDNKLTLGVDTRYYSNTENFDKLFLLLPGSNYASYYERLPKKGNWVVNARAFYTIKQKHTLGFMVKNMFNREYWLRVGRLESPRSVTFQYRLEI